MKIGVDIAEVDRIAIGVRLYDMFISDDVNSKVRRDNGKLFIYEDDINEMFKLVNHHQDLNVEVMRNKPKYSDSI